MAGDFKAITRLDKQVITVGYNTDDQDCIGFWLTTSGPIKR
jgi:hypothetical protein